MNISQELFSKSIKIIAPILMKAPWLLRGFKSPTYVRGLVQRDSSFPISGGPPGDRDSPKPEGVPSRKELPLKPSCPSEE